MRRHFSILVGLLLIAAVDLQGQIKLPRLLSDGAVFQREAKLNIRGWASVNESVQLSFNGKNFNTQADGSGNWNIILPSQPAGGPFDMTFKGKNEIIIKNILFGDVWICSGQSNMELTMERVKEKYATVIANSSNTNIRHFLVPDKYDFKKEHDDLDGGSWRSASPETLLEFSAVGYFFALELYQKYSVPIGLINASLGGSPAECWMSEDALKKFPDLFNEAQRFKNDQLIEEMETSDRTREKNWYKELNSKDLGITNKWRNPISDYKDWNEMDIPGFWADGTLGRINGSVWFQKTIQIPKSMIGKPGKLWLGRIVDADSVFVNGKSIGTTSYQYPPRKYNFGPDVLKEGENIISVRIINSAGRGGFVSDKPYFVAVDNDTIDLKGTWKYKLGTSMPPLQGPTAIRWKPVGLFNRMIAPLLNYPIKGVIWYQGEANTRRATEYRELFPALIENWRSKWGIGDFPFLFVQLANFMETKPDPTESQWAELREAQRLTLTKSKNTGMAVTIDLGEWNDIHPLNKQDVGKRLALAAQRLAYHDKKVIYSGPIYQSMKITGNKIELTFSNVGGGLVSKGGELKYFAIAGSNKKFNWAKAKIENNKVIVWSDEVKQPVSVRYAWADNPEGANLYNKEGLPASPFSTEN